MPSDVHRTPGKDECFRQLEKIRRDTGLTGFEYSELAEMTDWSRQHVVNTISGYYTEDADELDQPEADESKTVISQGSKVDITIPEGVDTKSYLQGYLAGLLADN